MILRILSNAGVCKMPNQHNSKDAKMERKSVSSSNLSSIGYDVNTNTLEVEFNSGAIYRYFDVPENVYSDLLNAGSHGSFFSHNIKNIYSFEKC